MDLIKKLTGKNPAEYESVAQALVDNSDTQLFEKLVKQDDFLFDFIKDNVAKRIQKACNSSNYKNLIPFMNYYSPSYDSMIGEVLNSYGASEIFPEMKNLLLSGNNAQKAYAAKFFSFYGNYDEMLDEIRLYAKSDYEPLSINSVELLSIVKDEISKNEAIENLASQDEFVQYEGVKFLVVYGAKETLPLIINVMKKSSLAENIASEILYMYTFEELFNINYDDAVLILCNVINAIPEIISPSSMLDYNLFDVFEMLIKTNLTSTSALAVATAKAKFGELVSNEEYLFDSDKNTKDYVIRLNELLKKTNLQRLKSLFYDELFDESDFVFFALDYVDEIEELEALLDCQNQTLVLKVLSILKEKGILTNEHKTIALNSITNENIKQIVEVL